MSDYFLDNTKIKYGLETKVLIPILAITLFCFSFLLMQAKPHQLLLSHTKSSPALNNAKVINLPQKLPTLSVSSSSINAANPSSTVTPQVSNQMTVSPNVNHVQSVPKTITTPVINLHKTDDNLIKSVNLNNEISPLNSLLP